MKLRIPLLLYVVSLGLFGLAGWTVYEMLPLRKDTARHAASRLGQARAGDCLGHGKGRGHALDWNYTPADWWAALEKVNLTGKLPKAPKEDRDEGKPVDPVVEVRPLEEIIELVSLVYDGEAEGRGGDTYVIVRYTPSAGVKPPEWYVRANMTAAASAPVPRGDAAPSRSAGPGGRRGNQPANPQGPSQPGRPNPAPGAAPSVGRAILQKVWVVDDGDPRHGNRLWPPFDDIRLVGVSRDAQVACFVRDLPPKEGGEAPEPKEESLLKANMRISAELLAELRGLQGAAPLAANGGTAVLPPNPEAWIDVPETKLVNGVYQVSKKDEERFRSPDEVLSQIHFDTYSGKSVKGLIVRNVDAKLAKTLGIAAGEVLLEINGRTVRSGSEALEICRGDYKRGVRAFVTRWLANGAIVERTYQVSPGTT